MTLLEPGVFATDVLLGALVLWLGVKLARAGNTWCRVFVTLAVTTWVGAGHHGFANTSDTVAGKVSWIATLTLLALTSAQIVDEMTGHDRRIRLVLAAAVAGYVAFALTVSDNFVYALLLQTLAVLAMGIRYRHTFPRPGNLYLGFLLTDAAAITVQRAGITLGLPWSHNTVFHLVEMPAMVLLYSFVRRLE